MEKEKKSFVLYNDILTVVEKLVAADRKDFTNKSGELFLAILRHSNKKDIGELDFIVELAFEPIKLSLDRDLEKYKTYINKQKANGRKGGRPKKDETQKTQPFLKETQKSQPLFSKPKKADSVSDSDSDSDSVSDSVNGFYYHKNINKEFFNVLCVFFCQTTDNLKKEVSRFLKKIKKEKTGAEFYSQTLAYIEFKKISNEKIHSWESYARQGKWTQVDWIKKLEKIKKDNGNNTNQTHSNR